jgi:Type I phosphodiesterase / nucleotide pyrophosphatase
MPATSADTEAATGPAPAGAPASGIGSLVRRGALAGAGGFFLAGLWVARLTLAGNPQLYEAHRDALLLLAWLAGGCGALGLVLGVAGGLAVAAAGRLGLPARHALPALVGVLALGPGLYCLLLPGTGLGGSLLSDALFASGPRQAALLAAALVVLAAAGLLLGPLLLPAGGGTVRALLPATLWGAAVVGITAGALAGPRPAAATAAAPGKAVPVALPSPLPPRVILLLMDGADLDDVVLPMAEAGELPHFSRLMEEGTWGPLATIEPTLSPVVWTTIATGKPPAEHGIRGFVFFRLPGIRRPIRQFPLHTGLNFRLFPLLERLPGMPTFRLPYTSDLRRVEALWTIAGRAYPVGVYRWLATWPPEPVNGFMVAGGFGWVQFVSGHAGEPPERVRGAVYPPDLFDRVPPEPRPRLTPAMLAPFLGGATLPPTDRRLRAIRAFLADPTSRLLPRLIAAFDTRLTAAAFYSVDPFHHYFGAERGGDGPFAGTVAAAYRHADARLGELLAGLEAAGEPFHLILVSDHGFDFVHHHHTWAPAGVFFARGPAFVPGRRVAALSVYDVAPLVLHLLGLPLPDDMPGVASGNYRQALDLGYLADHPARHVPTYEGSLPPRPAAAAAGSPIDGDIRDALKSLGYID